MPTCVESREKLEKQSSMMVSTETQSHDRDGTASLECTSNFPRFDHSLCHRLMSSFHTCSI